MKEIINSTESKFKKILIKLHERLSVIIATGAHPSILKGIEIDYYGAMTPLEQVATISAPDGTMLIVKPFEKDSIKNIVSAIHKSSLGLSPVDEGGKIRIIVPPLTEEKRKIFIKEAKDIGENFKISVRNIRIDSLKKIRSEELSENEVKQLEEELQTSVNKINKEINKIVESKTDSLSHV